MLFCIYAAGGLTCLVGETVVAMPKFLKLDVEIRWQKKVTTFCIFSEVFGSLVAKTYFDIHRNIKPYYDKVITFYFETLLFSVIYQIGSASFL